MMTTESSAFIVQLGDGREAFIPSGAYMLSRPSTRSDDVCTQEARERIGALRFSAEQNRKSIEAYLSREPTRGSAVSGQALRTWLSVEPTTPYEDDCPGIVLGHVFNRSYVSRALWLVSPPAWPERVRVEVVSAHRDDVSLRLTLGNHMAVVMGLRGEPSCYALAPDLMEFDEGIGSDD